MCRRKPRINATYLAEIVPLLRHWCPKKRDGIDEIRDNGTVQQALVHSNYPLPVILAAYWAYLGSRAVSDYFVMRMRLAGCPLTGEALRFWIDAVRDAARIRRDSGNARGIPEQHEDYGWQTALHSTDFWYRFKDKPEKYEQYRPHYLMRLERETKATLVALELRKRTSEAKEAAGIEPATKGMSAADILKSPHAPMQREFPRDLDGSGTVFPAKVTYDCEYWHGKWPQPGASNRQRALEEYTEKIDKWAQRPANLSTLAWMLRIFALFALRSAEELTEDRMKPAPDKLQALQVALGLENLKPDSTLDTLIRVMVAPMHWTFYLLCRWRVRDRTAQIPTGCPSHFPCDLFTTTRTGIWLPSIPVNERPGPVRGYQTDAIFHLVCDGSLVRSRTLELVDVHNRWPHPSAAVSIGTITKPCFGKLYRSTTPLPTEPFGDQASAISLWDGEEERGSRRKQKRAERDEEVRPERLRRAAMRDATIGGARDEDCCVTEIARCAAEQRWLYLERALSVFSPGPLCFRDVPEVETGDRCPIPPTGAQRCGIGFLCLGAEFRGLVSRVLYGWDDCMHTEAVMAPAGPPMPIQHPSGPFKQTALHLMYSAIHSREGQALIRQHVDTVCVELEPKLARVAVYDRCHASFMIAAVWTLCYAIGELPCTRRLIDACGGPVMGHRLQRRLRTDPGVVAAFRRLTSLDSSYGDWLKSDLAAGHICEFDMRPYFELFTRRFIRCQFATRLGALSRTCVWWVHSRLLDFYLLDPRSKPARTTADEVKARFLTKFKYSEDKDGASLLLFREHEPDGEKGPRLATLATLSQRFR